MTDAETIAKLTSELKAATDKGTELTAKLDAMEAAELDDDDRKVLVEIATSENGLRHSQIEAKTGFSPQRVDYHLTRLQKRNFIELHGRDLKPGRIHLGALGLDYLVHNKLI